MEPISVAASLIAIVQLTGACLKLGRKRIGPSSHSSTRLKEINTTLYGFNGTIKNLQTHLEIYEEDQARLETLDYLKEPFLRCGEALKLLNSRLQNDGFFAQYVLGARFDKKLEDCLRVLNDAKELLDLALLCDQRVLINAVETYVRGIAEESRDIKAAIAQNEHVLARIDAEVKHGSELAVRLHHEQTQNMAQVKTSIEKLSTDLEAKATQIRRQEQLSRRSAALSWLPNVDTRSNYLDTLQAREPGTGPWLLEHDLFQSWKNGDIQSLWLHGMPGAGKTFLSTAVIDHLERSSTHNVAYFYFDFKDPVKQSTESMVRSIAAQIENGLFLNQLSPALELVFNVQ